MNIIVSVKIVPDDQDIQVTSDRSLDFSKAKPTVSAYDLNAIEAAARLAGDGTVKAVTVGPKYIDDSKTKKNICARGVDELYLAVDDAFTDLDAHATATALAKIISEAGDYDIIICGDGSADNYAQQVDIQLAAALGLPVVNGVTEIVEVDGGVQLVRSLEDVVETVEVALPAVISVIPDIASPRIPGMKDILAAGKKPMNEVGAGVAENSLETLEVKAPEQAARKQVILDASVDGAVSQFIDAIKAAL